MPEFWEDLDAERFDHSEEIRVPREFEFLLTGLLGTPKYGNFVGFHRIRHWRDANIDVANCIQKCVQENLHFSDSKQRKEFEQLLENFLNRIKKAKRKDVVSGLAIQYLSKLIFMLVGNMPSNSTAGINSRKPSWDLQKYRSVYYVQSFEQKARLVQDEVEKYYKSKLKQIDFDVWHHFQKAARDANRKLDPAFIIEWTKENHPRLVSNLF